MTKKAQPPLFITTSGLQQNLTSTTATTAGTATVATPSVVTTTTTSPNSSVPREHKKINHNNKQKESHQHHENSNNQDDTSYRSFGFDFDNESSTNTDAVDVSFAHDNDNVGGSNYMKNPYLANMAMMVKTTTKSIMNNVTPQQQQQQSDKEQATKVASTPTSTSTKRKVTDFHKSFNFRAADNDSYASLNGGHNENNNYMKFDRNNNNVIVTSTNVKTGSIGALSDYSENDDGNNNNDDDEYDGSSDDDDTTSDDDDDTSDYSYEYDDEGNRSKTSGYDDNNNRKKKRGGGGNNSASHNTSGNETDLRSAGAKIRHNRAVFVNQLAKKETKQVNTMRGVVFCVLVLTSMIVTTVTYLFVKDNQQNQIQDTYKGTVDTIQQVSTIQMTNLMMDFIDLSETITIQSTSFNRFPYVTIDHFDLYASSIVTRGRHHHSLNNTDFTTSTSSTSSTSTSTSCIEMIAWIPLVQQNELERWMEYSTLIGPTWYEQSHIEHANQIQYYYNTTRNIEDVTTTTTTIDTYPNIVVVRDSVWMFPINTTRNKNNDFLFVPINTTNDSSSTYQPSSSSSTTSSNMSLYGPLWHTSPPPLNIQSINYDFLQEPYVQQIVTDLVPVGRDGVFTPVHSSVSRLTNIVWNPNAHERIFHNGNLNDRDEINIIKDDDTNTSSTTIATAAAATSSSSSSSSSNTATIPYYRPHSMYLQPVLEEVYNTQANVSGFLASVVSWDQYIENVISKQQGVVEGLCVVLMNTCNQSYTYNVVMGEPGEMTIQYLGEGDFHDPAYSDTEMTIPLPTTLLENVQSTQQQHQQHSCRYELHIYSSLEYETAIKTSTDNTTTSSSSNSAKIAAIVCTIIFVIVTGSFCLYDTSVRRRNIKILNAAVRSNQLVSSLFPTHVRDKLLHDNDNDNGNLTDRDDMSVLSSNLMSMKLKGDFLGLGTGSMHGTKSIAGSRHGGSSKNDADDDDDDDDLSVLFQGKPPIADLFTDTTILFGDIAGFTAWSSSREPTQVFVLLETVYHGFDEIAKRRKIFKVETVGDCYVAVAGLPDPRKDHAIAMCRFAKDILYKMRKLTRKLQRILGPETEELALRIGLHSGPVTAGVLRGQNSRFQLFGDTMNTAARMEQNGIRDKIHMSKETADLLIAAGKARWIIQRQDKIIAKGKGELETFWLVLKHCNSKRSSQRGSLAGNSMLSGTGSTDSFEKERDDRDMLESLASGVAHSKLQRLIDWNYGVFYRLLKSIALRRSLCPPDPHAALPNEERYTTNNMGSSSIPFEEVQEIITIPQFDHRVMVQNQVNASSDIDDVVANQLYDFVSQIAATYRNNPFHSFEHASHVTQSVIKLLSRIVAPTTYEEVPEEDDNGDNNNDDDNQSKSTHVTQASTNANNNNNKVSANVLHDHTYGITSDPLTQFACVFASLIHDSDHPGVPNAQLLKEQTSHALYYKEKSIAEQNSVDLAWGLLMQKEYTELRQAIYRTDEELIRFRQWVVNCVMATDIVDKELKALRNNRWEQAFSTQSISIANNNRKATIVIEHLIQASDVAHTMQHWNVYRRWNEKFFTECYKAYIDGRAEKDPTENWYKGEIGFFDFYIIPLAKKLKECGVFGVSSAEYLDYAIKNRNEWEIRGQEVVNEMIEKVQQQYHQHPPTAQQPQPLEIQVPAVQVV